MENVQNLDAFGCKVIQFSIRITELCNRDCSYCHYHGMIDYELKDLKKIIDITTEHAFTLKRTPLYYFHGGEPTISKNLIPILKYIKLKNSRSVIELQTNFDNPEKTLEILPLIDLLNISFHFEKNKRKVISYKDKLKYFNNKILLSKLNYIDLMFSNNIKDIMYLRKYFQFKNIKTEITFAFFQNDNNQDFNKLTKLFKLSKKEISKNRYFNGEIKVPNNYICDTSYYTIINGNGSIFKCSYELTEYLKNPNDKKPLNIIENKDNLRKVMSKNICKFKTCGYELDYLKDFN